MFISNLQAILILLFCFFVSLPIIIFSYRLSKENCALARESQKKDSLNLQLSQDLEFAEEELEKIKEDKKDSSYEVKDLLQDLLTGSALIQIKRISPESVFLRSTKDLR